VRGHLIIVALVSILVVALPAAAEEPRYERTRLMLFGPGTDDETREAAQKLRRRMDLRGAAPRVVHPVSEALPMVTDESLRAYGDVLVQECPGEQQPADVVLEAIDRGMREFDALEYRAAIDAFAEAEAALPCLSGFLPQGRISDLYFFHGVAAFYADGPEVARSLFARSLAALPSRPWDDRFPPPPQQVFLDAGASILHTPPREVLASDPKGSVQEIRVDSAGWDGYPFEPFAVTAGSHLIQWRLTGGEVHSLQVEVVPGGQLVLLTGPGLQQAVLDGGRDAGLGQVVAPALRRLAIKGGVDEVVIVRVGERPLVTLFDPVGGVFEPTQKERFASSFEEQRQRWGPRGGISLGIGFYSIIAPGDEWDFQYMSLVSAGEFRIVAGLYLDVNAHIGIRRGEVNRESIVALPSSRIGIKYALRVGSTRPYLGVAGQTSVYGREDVALGGGAVMGMALEFPNDPRLRLGIDLFVGRVRNWCIHATGQIGVYY
jgi:hypothetical protein